MCQQGRSSADRHPGHCGVCGDRVRRELGRHRAVRPHQAGLAFLSLANGIPSHDTFRRVFMLIDPDAFEACFTAWAQSCADAFDREVVAIDGKRRSFDRGRAQGPLHLVSASEQGLALGQREVDGKSNEITAIPALLETLSLKNCIVTLDAMGCQKTIANQILDRGADYLLVLNTARRSWR